MDLMEYQGKNVFRAHAIATTPQGQIATTVKEAVDLATDLGLPVMVKAQVLTGGRGKAGGVKFCPDLEAVEAAAKSIIGLDISGHTVHKVLIEPASDIKEEFYLSILHDRVSKGYLVICSVEGGMDIEEVNRTTPEKVAKVAIDPTKGIDYDLAYSIVKQGGLPKGILPTAAKLLVDLYKAFVASDATLMEINPLIINGEYEVIALDSKVSIDGNALFRQKELAALEGPIPAELLKDDLEARGRELGLMYVKLDGFVGIIGNGAGLVMSTLDVVAQAGGKAANFLDIGGGASAESMSNALRLVLSDSDVSVIMVNIFGGITQCDLIAEGVLGALELLGDVKEKIVVRLDGTNAEEGRAILNKANHPNIVAATGMLEAAKAAVELSGKAN